MDWNQIRSMMESGRLTIGSHSVSHPLLAQLPHQEIEVELTKSKEVIEEKGFLDVFSGTGTISFTEKTQPEYLFRTLLPQCVSIMARLP